MQQLLGGTQERLYDGLPADLYLARCSREALMQRAGEIAAAHPELRWSEAMVEAQREQTLARSPHPLLPTHAHYCRELDGGGDLESW